MKKSLKKIILIVALAVVALLVTLAVVVHLWAGSAVKFGIETAATKKLEVGVSVDEVDLKILRGQITLSRLEIDNPSGYQYDQMLGIGKIFVKADTGSLLSDTAVIEQIKIDDVNVVLEQKGMTNNLQEVLKRVSAQSKDEPGSDKPDGGGKKLRVSLLEVSNINVTAKLLPVPGRADSVKFKLGPIVMRDLGTDKKLNTAGLAGKFMVSLTQGIAEKGAGLLPQELTSSMKTQLKNLENISGELTRQGEAAVQSGKELTEDVIKKGEDIGKEVTEGFKKLLTPKEDK